MKLTYYFTRTFFVICFRSVRVVPEQQIHFRLCERRDRDATALAFSQTHATFVPLTYVNVKYVT